ncbi:cytochrome P450 6g1-like [Haematobia irritans]|uniref:cytochrome P450 6g1-like n=1 Tax=Haematobia irritans TaxID=7368 RepID=UPI003F501E34
MLIYLVCGLLAIILALYQWYKNHFQYWEKYPTVVSVPGRIFSGNLWDILTFKTNFGFRMKDIYLDKRFQTEAVVGVYALKPALLIRDPELIKSILIRDFNCFTNRISHTEPHDDPVGSKTLFISRDGEWKEIRSKFSAAFSGVKLKQMYPLIQQIGENLESYLNQKGDHFICEFRDIAYRYAIDTISTTVFGINCDCLGNPENAMNSEARKLSAVNLKRGLDFMAIAFLPALRKLGKTKFFYDECYEFVRNASRFVLAERERNGIHRNDLVDLFVKLKKEAIAQGKNLEELQEIIDAQMIMFLGGGTETTSTTIVNILFELSKQPAIQNRLRDEIQENFRKGNGSISYESLIEMKYLNMVIDETLRMYPVFPLSEREYLNPNHIDESYSLKPFCDFSIPPGMGVYISVYGLHYDPKYCPEPEKFNPERFSPENKKFINPMVYLPYSSGPRYCIGARMGQLQTAAGIVHALKNHYVKVCSETNLKAEYNTKAFFLQTKGGIHLEVVKDDRFNKSLCQ